MTPGERWGSALKGAMKSRRVPSKNLAAALGISKSSVSEYRTGSRFPRMETAARFAEALATPYLLELCGILRTRTCDECDWSYVNDQKGGAKQRFCSIGCRGTSNKRAVYRYMTDRTHKRYDKWKRRATRTQAAVDAMCRACEPEGACRQSDCELRGVSPLPLIDMIPTPIAASGVVRVGPSPAATKHRLEYNREWIRRKRA